MACICLFSTFVACSSKELKATCMVPPPLLSPPPHCILPTRDRLGSDWPKVTQRVGIWTHVSPFLVQHSDNLTLALFHMFVFICFKIDYFILGSRTWHFVFVLLFVKSGAERLVLTCLWDLCVCSDWWPRVNCLPWKILWLRSLWCKLSMYPNNT